MVFALLAMRFGTSLVSDLVGPERQYARFRRDHAWLVHRLMQRCLIGLPINQSAAHTLVGVVFVEASIPV